MPPFSFEGKILKAFEGSEKPGSSIQVSTSTGEEASAMSCKKAERSRLSMCFELGYLCPNCGGPLYSSKGYEKITGSCPVCQKTVA